MAQDSMIAALSISARQGPVANDQAEAADAPADGGGAPPPLPGSSSELLLPEFVPGKTPSAGMPPPLPGLPALPPQERDRGDKGRRKSDSRGKASKHDKPEKQDARAATEDPFSANLNAASLKPAAPELPPASAPAADEAPASPPPQRRSARRRAAGPVRNKIAANDDAPSIGGLIYALDQKPDNTPFRYATIAGGVWTLIGLIYVWFSISTDLSAGATVVEALTKPGMFFTASAIFVPVAVLQFLALLAWRSEELRLRSSTMTEVAVRLAEPDRMAEQSVASLGQAVRRQVSFMNDAVSRALGRAGELEALVHNEVSALERSYEENERKIRGLIEELAGERHALMNTSRNVTDTLQSLGTDIPGLIEKLSLQQIKLAQIIQGAGENLTSLETAVAHSAEKLEGTLGVRTDQLQTVLETYTSAIGTAIGSRTGEMRDVLDNYTNVIGQTMGARTGEMQNLLVAGTGEVQRLLGAGVTEINQGLAARTGEMRQLLDERSTELQSVLTGSTGQMQQVLDAYTTALAEALTSRGEQFEAVFEEYGRALDTNMANRAQSLDVALVERTAALDQAFGERLRQFDESIMRSTLAIDRAVTDKSTALTTALDTHARVFSETISRQSLEIDEALVQGINSVRRSSENITRQSLKAIEGLASQSDMLRNVSENLLGQINAVTGRFENQGQTIMKAANALESVNYKIDVTLQNRHTELAGTLDKLSGKADDFGRMVQGYTATIEGTLGDAEQRARAISEQLRQGAEVTKRTTIEDLERLRHDADVESQRTLEDLRNRFANVSTTVTEQLGSLSSRFDQTSDDVRQRAAKASAEIAAEQMRLREQIDHLPTATRESTETMRRALQDQLKALEQLSSLTNRTAAARDAALPLPAPTSPAVKPAAPMAHDPRGEDITGGRRALSAPPAAAPIVPAPLMPASPQPPAATADAARAMTPRSEVAPRAPAPQPAPRPAAGNLPGIDMREGWSLGDLLARASRDEDGQAGGVPAAGPSRGPAGGFRLDAAVIARALDPVTAQSLWARIRAGQRGVMVRSMYTPDGRNAFDEITRQYRLDPELKQTVDQYVADFERVSGDLDRRDPTGRSTESQMVSDQGRVYLFLAHATGRI